MNFRESFCILVAGMPASGKSTMAKYLSEQLGLPMISKDNLKEILFDEIGFNSRAEKNKLGVASARLMYHVAEQFMRINAPFILENNFENATKPELMELLEKYGYTAITLRLTGDCEKIYERFAKRDRSPERHRGHVVNDCYPEPKGSVRENPTMLDLAGFKYGLEHRGYNSFCANGPCIEVDTTDIAGVDLEEVLSRVRESVEE